LAIILRDTPPESQIGSPLTLYLSYWASLQYPIGLLPGSKVIFRFVQRITGKEGSVYLRSSLLTSLEVLELPTTGNNDEYVSYAYHAYHRAVHSVLHSAKECGVKSLCFGLWLIIRLIYLFYCLYLLASHT